MADEVVHATQIGWHELGNGELIRKGEIDGFQALVTTDKNLQYQQKLTGRRISIIVLSPRLVVHENLVPLADRLNKGISDFEEGSFHVIKPEIE